MALGVRVGDVASESGASAAAAAAAAAFWEATRQPCAKLARDRVLVGGTPLLVAPGHKLWGNVCAAPWLQGDQSCVRSPGGRGWRKGRGGTQGQAATHTDAPHSCEPLAGERRPRLSNDRFRCQMKVINLTELLMLTGWANRGGTLKAGRRRVLTREPMEPPVKKRS